MSVFDVYLDGLLVGTDSDEKVKVSSNDTVAGYLNGKLVAGDNITFVENNDGGNETLTISTTGAKKDFTVTAWQDFTTVASTYTLTLDENASTPYDITTDLSKVINNLNRFEVVKNDDSQAPVRPTGLANYFTYVSVIAYNPATGLVTLSHTPNDANFRIVYKYTYDYDILPDGKLYGSGVSQEVIDANASDEAREIEYDNTSSGLTAEDVQDAIDEVYDKVNVAKVITVATSGGDFSSIQSAIDSVTDATNTNRYLINIAPGLYLENIAMKDYVVLQGNGGVIIAYPVAPLITGATNLNDIRNMQLLYTGAEDGVDLLDFSASSGVAGSLILLEDILVSNQTQSTAVKQTCYTGGSSVSRLFNFTYVYQNTTTSAISGEWNHSQSGRFRGIL